VKLKIMAGWIIILALLISLVPPAAVFTVSAENDVPEGFLVGAESAEYVLYYQYAAAAIAVKNKTNGKLWTSCLPADQIPQQGVTDFIRDEFNSLVTVGYTLINRKDAGKNTLPLEAMKHEVVPTKSHSGIVYTITLPEINLIFDVNFQLEDNALIVSIPDENIREGAGVEAQLEARKTVISEFIKKTNILLDELNDDSDTPKNLRTQLKNARKELGRLEDTNEKIKDMSGIADVSESMLATLDALQTQMVGASSRSGFFNSIEESAVSAAVKGKFARLKQRFEDDRMPAWVNITSLKAIDVGYLTEIEIMPYFGAGGDKTEGYILYPDGSGAINEFKEKHGKYAGNYKVFTYSDPQPDIDWQKSLDGAGLKRLTVPYFGVKQSNSAFIGYVFSGQSESAIQFSPSGYIFNVSRIDALFEYRRQVAVSSTSGKWQAGQIPTAYELPRRAVNAGVRYTFLEDNDADYSGMARSLRSYLEKNGSLKKSSVYGDDLPLALDIFGGYTQRVLVFDNYIIGTTFSQAQQMINQIAGDKKLPLLVNYQGYRTEGYGVYPSKYKVAAELGGDSDLKSLTDTINNTGGRLFLEDNPLEVQIGRGGYNEGDLALSAYYRVYESLDKTTFLLSPSVIKSNMNKSAWPFFKSFSKSGVTLAHMGSFIYYDYSDDVTQRSDTAAVWQSIMERAKAETGGVAIDAGNAYTWAYADWLRGIPTGTSGYPHTDYAIPFCQMLIHGSIPYTSEPVNQFYDRDLQFLQMVEYGQIPYFTLTAEAVDTDEAGVFVSRFDVFCDEISETYNRYSTSLAGLADQKITSHHKENDVAEVTYDDGTMVIINYNNTAITQNGQTVEAMSFAVTQPKGGVELEASEYLVSPARKSGWLSLYRAVGGWILPVLLVPVVLFIGSRIFKNYRQRKLSH